MQIKMPNIFSDSKGPQLSPPILLNLLPFIPYPDFQAATGQLELTSQYHKMCRLIGHPGAGKTRLLLEFERTHENAYYICPSRTCRTKDVLRLLGKPLGYYIPAGNSNQVVWDLIDFLNNRGCDTTFTKLGERYGKERLESACARVHAYGTTPSIRNISSILKSKQDVKAKT